MATPKSKLSSKVRHMVVDLKSEGWGATKIAKKLNIGRASVYRILREHTAADDPPMPPTVSPRALPSDPRDRLEAIRDAWIDLALKRLERLLDETSKDNTQDAIQAGIASQRAVECQKYLDQGKGLPETLPEDDDAARRAVMQAWWLTARGGGQTSARHLAGALGIRTIRQQPISISYADEDDDGGRAPDNGEDSHSAEETAASAGAPNLN